MNVDAIRTLHANTMDVFKFSEGTRKEVNDLLDECEQMLTGVKMIQELSPKSLDQLVSYGERCSVRIMAARLNQIGVPAQAFDAWEVGILTDSQFGDAKLLPEHEGAVQRAFERIDKGIVAIVTGFIGHDPNGKITTLGRGGSDLTATALGASLGSDEIQVWKDVDGILSTDPRVVPGAIPLDQISYEEASELAYFGAQVLHPIAMQPAMKYNVPVRVKNSYNPSAVGTYIKQEKSLSQRLVSRIYIVPTGTFRGVPCDETYRISDCCIRSPRSRTRRELRFSTFVLRRCWEPTVFCRVSFPSLRSTSFRLMFLPVQKFLYH